MTPFYPRSPYGVSKVFAHYITVNYRESYDLFAVSGILFNHESPRRGLEFVTAQGQRRCGADQAGAGELVGAGQSRRAPRLGYAGDHVRAMWLMMQQDEPADYVIATGISHAVRDLVETAFSHVGLDWHDYVRTDPACLRPAEVEHLIGDASNARRVLAGHPRSTSRPSSS